MYYGHGGAALALFAFLASAGFLVWVGEKPANPHRRIATLSGLIAFVISALLVIGSIYTCVASNFPDGLPCLRHHPKMGRGMWMGPGREMRQEMGPMPQMLPSPGRGEKK